MKTKKTTHTKLITATFAAFLATQSLSVSAQTLYQITFTGEITTITSSSPFWSGISIGDSFIVTATYDSNPTAYSSISSNFSGHSWSAGQYQLSATFGSYEFIAPSFELEIRDNLSGQNGFIFGNSTSFSSNGLNFTAGDAFAVGLINSNGSFDPISSLTVDSVPQTDLSNFNYNNFRLFNGSFNSGLDTASVEGFVTNYTLSSTAIPEPSSAAYLCGIGAIFAAFMKRRRIK